jgi:signal transduction histidine kinase
MSAISLIITGFTMVFLYKAAIHEEKRRLVETVESQARIIEAMAKFDAEYSQSYAPGGARGATLLKLNAAHNNYEQARMTVEFVLAERKDNWISFLIRHRHGGLEEYLKPVVFDSELAVPMRLALLGKSGTIIAEDYRGELVLAAYEPVAVLNLGIVAKIDLSEIRAPYIRASCISGLFAILMVGSGAILFVRISNPIINVINDQNAKLSKTNESLQREVRERIHAEAEIKKAHSELEMKVKRRTAELSETNTVLNKEIYERSEAQQKLKRNEIMLKKTFDGILDPLILLDKHMAVMMMNKAAVDYYKTSTPEDVIGKPCYQVLMGTSDICEGCSVTSAFSSENYISYERNGIVDPDRVESVTAYPITERDGSVTSIVTRISDITEKKMLERQLIQKEKLAALGVMVSSMAHEINNPNNFISFNIPILRDYVREMLPMVGMYAAGKPEFELFNLSYPEFEEDIHKLLVNIENGSKRISSLISTLREYSFDKTDASRTWVDLTYAIDSVISICHSQIIKSVKSFIKHIPENLPSIHTQPYAVEQILINFLINASHAVDKDDSWIKLEVTVNGNDQKQVRIAVSDNGQGMDEKIQSKIFDPFFTTKSPEGGTGLGLFVSHTLAERMGGHIEVESETGKGSRFVLTLPVKDPNLTTGVEREDGV